MVGMRSTSAKTAMHRPIWALVAATVGLYCTSLLLPTTSFWKESISGYVTFLLGLVMLLGGEPREISWWLIVSCWSANVAIVSGVILLATNRLRAAWIAGLCGVVLALSGLPVIYSDVSNYPGFWVWLGSAALLAGWRQKAAQPRMPTELTHPGRGQAENQHAV